MPKILILIGGHLSTAPRPQKEASTLAVAGYEVLVKGCWFDSELSARDVLLVTESKWAFSPYLDISKSGPIRLKERIKTRAARELFKWFGIFSPELLGYGVRQMLKAALAFNADLTIVHSEGGLWVGAQLIKQGYKVGIDFEDWFSEDLLPEARKSRPIELLGKLERELAQQCRYVLTTSNALAGSLAATCQTSPPVVIRNTFPLGEREKLDGNIEDRKNLNLPSLHWFSQTIGPGRGLEDLFASLSLLNTDVELHLRGNCSELTKQWVVNSLPAAFRELVFIHPTVPNEQLLSRIAEHDIGLALEVPFCRSRNLTTTNKLFQYLQGGLAIIATDTSGQREVFEKYPEIGFLVPPSSPEKLAQAITELVSDTNELAKKRGASLKAFKEQFNWEAQIPSLLKAIAEALS